MSQNNVSQPTCKHTHITSIDWPDGGYVEFCEDCEKSRYCWEDGSGDWQVKGNIDVVRYLGSRLKAVLKEYEGGKQ